MARFEITTRQRPLTGRDVYVVVDHEEDARPVAKFGKREAAEAHARLLNAGPQDWDEQEAWKDDDEDDDPATP